MSNLHVEHGTTAKLGHVEGELRVSSNARITAANGSIVSVSGRAYFEGNAEIDCDFECDSLLVDKGKLRVNGSLTVRNEMDVAHSVEVEGKIRAQRIDVGGKLCAKGVNCERSVVVGGVVDVSGALEAESVEVGGKFSVSGRVKMRDLGVGGKADVGGGAISGNIKVGGFFASSSPLEFGDMQVFGKCTLAAGCKGRKISTYGKLSAAGDFACEEIDVGGFAEVHGDCRAGKVSVNGRAGFSGSLTIDGALQANGSIEVRDEVSASDLRAGGFIRARKIVVANQVEVSGEVETDEGLKGKTVLVRTGSRCKGPVVGQHVKLGKSGLSLANWEGRWAGQTMALRLVGRMTEAEDIYADEAHLEENSKCKRIFARKVELARGCIVDEIVFTEELKGDDRARLTQPPRKAQSLPAFPL